MEILRRLILLAGVFAAIWMAFWPVPGLMRVSLPDFQETQKRRTRWRESPRAPLNEFITEETKDRTIAVEGREWEEVRKAAAALKAGQTVDAAWALRKGGSYVDQCLFFSLDEPPVNALAGKLNADRSFTYVSFPSGGRTEYLDVVFVPPPDAQHTAPGRLLYPHRRFSLWVLLAALLSYALLPWPELGAQTIHYSRLRGAVLPDVAGLMLTGLFFALPILVIPANVRTPSLFDADGGWIFLTLIAWAFVAGCLSIHCVAAWYASFQIQLLPDHMQRVTLLRTELYAYGDIAGVQLVHYSAPRWLMVLGFLVSLFNWRALGPTLLAGSRQDPGLQVICHDGRKFHFWLTSLQKVPLLVETLRAAGVPVDPQVDEVLQDA